MCRWIFRIRNTNTCPSIFHLDKAARSDRGTALHLLYNVLFDIIMYGHLTFMILLRCFLWHMSSLAKTALGAAQLLALYIMTMTTYASYTFSFLLTVSLLLNHTLLKLWKVRLPRVHLCIMSLVLHMSDPKSLLLHHSSFPRTGFPSSINSSFPATLKWTISVFSSFICRLHLLNTFLQQEV